MGKKDRVLPNHRHERFCNLFVFGHPKHDPDDKTSPPDTRDNGTRSYMMAGFRATGRSARVLASRLLARVDVLARIAELRNEEQSIRAAFLHHWKSLLPDAQRVLMRAVNGEAVTPVEIQAAREIIEQAQGPTRFRFGVDKGADKDGSLNITLWSGRKE